MKFCPVVPEIFRGQVHMPKKERKENNNNNNNKIIIIIIIIMIILIIVIIIIIITGTTGQNFMKLGGVIYIYVSSWS
jgi:flagellar basal body-associated protein FliL